MTSFAAWKAAVEKEIDGASFDDVMIKRLLGGTRREALHTSLSDADVILAKEAHALIVEPRPPADLSALPPARASLDEGLARFGIGPALQLAMHLASADAWSDRDSNVTFEVSIGSDIWTEVAKLRALRLGWAKLQVLRKRTPKWAHIIATSVSPALTLREPWVNLLRNAHVAFASIVGGADDVVLVPFDIGYRPQSELGRRMVHNVRRLIEHEGQLAKVKDPAHGSFAIEALSCQLLRHAWAILERIDSAGGYAAFHASGALHALCDADIAERTKLIRSGALNVTGITAFVDRDPEKLGGYPTSVLGVADPQSMEWTCEAAIDGVTR